MDFCVQYREGGSTRKVARSSRNTTKVVAICSDEGSTFQEKKEQ